MSQKALGIKTLYAMLSLKGFFYFYVKKLFYF